MKMIDLLYSNYFNQLIRTHNSNTFVEKSILDIHTDILREYILEHSRKIRDSIKEYEDRKTKSIVTWNKEYYEKVSKDKYDTLDKFEKEVKETISQLFLEKDFSKTNSEIDIYYELPKSEVREEYQKVWEKIKNKDN